MKEHLPPYLPDYSLIEQRTTVASITHQVLTTLPALTVAMEHQLSVEVCTVTFKAAAAVAQPTIDAQSSRKHK